MAEMFRKETPQALDAKIKNRWGKLTDYDIEDLHGNLNALPGKLQQIYGKPKDIAEREVAEFRRSLTGSSGMTSGSSSSESKPKSAGM